jgi:hypothetical protein
MGKLEKIGMFLCLVLIGFIFGAAVHRHVLSVELIKLEIMEKKLTLEKLGYELSIYREQEENAKQVIY